MSAESAAVVIIWGTALKTCCSIAVGQSPSTSFSCSSARTRRWRGPLKSSRFLSGVSYPPSHPVDRRPGVRDACSPHLCVRRLYAEMTVFCHRVSLPCNWAIGPSTRKAQRLFNVVARRQNAGPFVCDTKLRRQETADHSYMGNGAVARASFGWLMHHGDAIVI
jgi:hypothetical protein